MSHCALVSSTPPQSTGVVLGVRCSGVVSLGAPVAISLVEFDFIMIFVIIFVTIMGIFMAVLYFFNYNFKLSVTK